MQIIIDGKVAALKQGSSFDFVAENRMFSGSDSYTLTITFPLKDCPRNLEIFGDLTRSELPVDDYVFDCEIRDRAFSRFGTLTITEISDVDVKAQFLEGRAEQNFAKDFDETYVNELDLGSHPSASPAAVTPEQAWDPEYTDWQAVALPWVSADSGTPHNFADYDKSSGKYSWCSDVTSLTWLPYLIHITKQICAAIGYDVDLSEWESDIRLRRILICNVLPNGWDINTYNRILPHWTVSEFFEKLELFLRGYFDIDHRAKTISFGFFNSALESTPPVCLEAIVDEYSSNIKSDGSECDYIDVKNIAYKDAGHQLSNFYSCDWLLEPYSDPESDERIYHYATIKDMIDAQKSTLSISDWEMNNPDYSGGGSHRNPNTTGIRRLNIYYVVDNDMYFAKRLISQTLDQEHSKKNFTYYNSRYVLQPLNEFGPRRINVDSDDCEEMEFVPACIDFSEDEYGFCLFVSFSSYSESYDNDSTFLSSTNGEINWAIPYGGKQSVQKMIETGKKDGRQEYFDVISLGIYWGYYVSGQLPYPMASSVYLDKAGLPVAVFDQNLRINDCADQRWIPFYHIDRTRKVSFRFLSDDIPDPRAVFYIRGRRYICEKITATFTEDGMSQLLKGEFWPLLD